MPCQSLKISLDLNGDQKESNTYFEICIDFYALRLQKKITFTFCSSWEHPCLFQILKKNAFESTKRTPKFVINLWKSLDCGQNSDIVETLKSNPKWSVQALIKQYDIVHQMSHTNLTILHVIQLFINIWGYVSESNITITLLPDSWLMGAFFVYCNWRCAAFLFMYYFDLKTNYQYWESK